MKKLLFLLALPLILAACSEKKSLGLPAETSEDTGLNSSITVNGGINTIVTQDYIIDPSKVDSVTTDFLGMKAALSEDKQTITLDVQGIPNLGNLAIWVDGVPYSILLKLSDETEVTFTYDPQGKKYKRVQLAGQMNDWVPDRFPDLTLNRDGKYEVTFRISPGTYLYQVVRDGVWLPDENNPEKVDNHAGSFNSLMHIKGNLDKAPVLIGDSFDEDHIRIRVLTQNPADSVPEGMVYAYWQNYKLPMKFINLQDSLLEITIPKEAEDVKRSYIRVITANRYGISNDILAPLEYGKPLTSTGQMTRFDKHGEILYSLIVDRFMDADTTNNHPMHEQYPEVNPKVDYFGGDIKGITQKIKDGYFDKMGFSTIWISPIVQNPLEPWGELTYPVKTKFAGYHGYWPISSSKIDFRLGTDEDMIEMVNTAHEHGINVIMDYVANHVHRNHPLFLADSTICTPLYLPDGRKNIGLWDEQRLTTWFDEHIPTLDYSRPEILESQTDSAVQWITKFNLDGFRHDACKHIPDYFWRTLTHKLKTRVEIPEGKQLYQVGESYGSPQLIKSYVNSGMLNAQFDFNVSDEAGAVFQQNSEDFRRISNILEMSHRFYGSHSLMGYITGNHDRARFISYASGDLRYDEDSKAAGWLRDIQVSDTTAYDKLVQLNAFNMTIPGVPVVYYGDEFGDPGANDPDCRRMMRFDDQLNKYEQRTRDAVAKIAHIRKSSLPLIYGDFVEFGIDKDEWAYGRNYFGETVVVVFNRNTQEKQIKTILPSPFNGKTYKAEFGHEFTLDGDTLSVTLPANSFEILTMVLP